MKGENFYFDVLPLHPRPQILESLTSYIVRLAEANSIKSVSHLTQTCFSDYLQAIYHLNDFPMRSLRVLQTTAQCSEAEIKAMTFCHLGEKFGRTYHPNSCSFFLQHSIAHSLRYCPYCLKERGYYSLLWRFQLLKGCAEHGCSLLDTCWHCNATLPVFPFQSLVGIGICPSCWKNLGAGQSPPLLPKEQEETFSFSQDLIFLLSPLTQDTMAISLEYCIGKQFTSLRQGQSLSVLEVAKQTMLPSHKVVGIEYAFPDTYTVSFECYVQYAKVLTSSFCGIFEEALVRSYSEGVSQTSQIQISEEEVIDRVQKAIDMLITRRKPLSKRAAIKFAQLLRAPVIPSPTLLQHLERVVYNGRVEQRRKTAFQNKMLELEVLAVIRSLEVVGKPVTYGSISNKMNFSYASFEDDLWDIRAVNNVIGHLLAQQQFRIDEEGILLTRLEIAIDQLEEVGEPIVRGTILRVVERSEQNLSRYPQLEALLKTIPTTSFLSLKREKRGSLLSLRAEG